LKKEIFNFDSFDIDIDTVNYLIFVREAHVRQNSILCAYDYNGKEIIPKIFNEISPLGDGLFALRKGTKWGLTNAKGDKLLLLEHTFEEVERKAARFR
jgi:hypothetical protein